VVDGDVVGPQFDVAEFVTAHQRRHDHLAHHAHQRDIVAVDVPQTRRLLHSQVTVRTKKGPQIHRRHDRGCTVGRLCRFGGGDGSPLAGTRIAWQADRMQIGIVYPQTELRGDPDAVRRIGKAVEDLGFDHLLTYEHVLGAVHADRARPLTGPYTEHHPFHDPFVMFGYLAGITERIQFATGVLILPQRQTALVARQAADVDLLSGGRLRLGVGVGWSHVEYEALGQNFRTRGAREEEQIELLRRLFREPVVDFTGRFDRIDRAALVPKPARPIPIWLGGFGDAAFERAARLADGFIFGGGLDNCVPAWKQMRERVRGLGRSVDDFGADLTALTREGVREIPAKIDSWRNAGGTHASVVTMGLGFDSVDAHLDYIASVADVLGLK